MIPLLNERNCISFLEEGGTLICSMRNEKKVVLVFSWLRRFSLLPLREDKPFFYFQGREKMYWSFPQSELCFFFIKLKNRVILLKKRNKIIALFFLKYEDLLSITDFWSLNFWSGQKSEAIFQISDLKWWTLSSRSIFKF